MNQILNLIGNTPIVTLKNNPNIKVKIEGFNPGGSIKDRVALNMIEQAEKRGQLTKRKTILEASSGNTGIGLAWIGAVKGYNVEIVLSMSVSEEKKKILRLYGAKLIETSIEEGTDGAIRMAEKMHSKDVEKYWWANQYDNNDNPLAHKKTAFEISKQIKELDYLVVGVGTSGTLVGLGREIHGYFPGVKIIAVESANNDIDGLKNIKKSITPKIYQKKIADRVVYRNKADSFDVMKKISKKEGLLLGLSTSALLSVSFEISQLNKDKSILVISPDNGDRYLSKL